jgi:hypothetical protein
VDTWREATGLPVTPQQAAQLSHANRTGATKTYVMPR